MIRNRFHKKLQVRNLLTGSVVYERESGTELRGLCEDTKSGLIWVFGDHELYVVNIQSIFVILRFELKMKIVMYGSYSFNRQKKENHEISRKLLNCVKTQEPVKRFVVLKLITTSTRMIICVLQSTIRIEECYH